MNTPRALLKKITPPVLKNFIARSRAKKILNAQIRRWWKFPQQRHKECLVLLNGPSVSLAVNNILNYKNIDIVTVNNYIYSSLSAEIFPYIHVLVDPDYFNTPQTLPEDYQRQVEQVYAALSIAKTPLWLAVPYYAAEFVQNRIGNDLVTIIGIPTEKAPSFNTASLQTGEVGFGLQNVLIPALYTAIMTGYKKIWLIGAEADSITYLRVDERCFITRSGYTYFNADSPPPPTASMIKRQGPMAKELLAWHLLFQTLEDIAAYARDEGISIVNLSLKSMLDMFPKGPLGASPFPWRVNDD